MELQVTDQAAQWYKEELQIETDINIRLYIRFGEGGYMPGFSIGIRKDSPVDILTSERVDSIFFYIEESDGWYFSDTNLSIEFDLKRDEPYFYYY